MRRWRRRAGLGGALLLAAIAGGVIAARGASTTGVLRTVTLSGFLSTMVIDTRTSRAFVATWSDTGRAYVDVLDTASGALLRTVATGSGNPNEMSPDNIAIDAPTNRVFVTNPGDETMRVLDARPGALLRTVVVGYMAGEGGQSMVVDTRTDRVFLWASGLRVIDARSGAILRTLINMGDNLAMDEQAGRVFVADGFAGTVKVLDARSGTILRTLKAAHARVVASAATGHVFVTVGTVLRMFDARTGQLLRTIPVGTRVGWDQTAQTFMAPAAGDPANSMLVLSPMAGSGRLILVDARTGRIRRTPVLGSLNDTPLLDRRTGHLFVAGTSSATSGDGRVWMIDAHSGALLRTITVDPNPSSIVLDERAGRVLVASRGVLHGYLPTGPGSVSVIDARSGALLRAVPVGVGPGLMGVDERMGRAFVATYGGPAQVSDPWGWVPRWLRLRLPVPRPPASSTRMVPGSVSVLDVAR